MYLISDDKKETTADITVDELIIDLNINQSIEDDTFISQNDTTFTMSHHNMVRLIPCPQTTVSRENSRQPIVSPIVPHPNTVKLLPFPQSSTASVASPHSNRLQPTSSTYVLSSHANCFQPTTSTSVFNPRVNRFQPISPASVVSSRVNRVQPTTSTSVVNSNIYRPRTNTNISSSSGYQSNIGGHPCRQTNSPLRTQNVRYY